MWTRSTGAPSNSQGPNLDSSAAPQSADPHEVVEALRQVLFVEEEFTGEIQDYTNPLNSSIEHVLATRKGLPILLSHVVVAVSQRLRLPVVGLAIPGRYMVKYDGVYGPVDYTGEDIIIDPFEGGKVLTLERLQQAVVEMGYGFDPIEYLKPCTHRAALARMLTNLVNHLHHAERHSEADLAKACLDLMESGIPPKPHR